MRRYHHEPLVHAGTAELRAPSCGANSCPYCAMVKRRKIARAVGAAEPTAFLTMTLAGDEWPVIQMRMRNMRRRLVRHGYPYEWVWLVECNLKGVRHHHHVHALAYGDLPGAGTFTEYAEHAGFGRESYIENLRSPRAAVRYLWGDSKRLGDDVSHFLEMNAGRLEHASKPSAEGTGYWRVNGEPMHGWEAAWTAIQGNAASRRRSWALVESARRIGPWLPAVI